MKEKYNPFQEQESSATSEYLRVQTLSKSIRDQFNDLPDSEKNELLKRLSFAGPRPYPKPQEPVYPLTEEQEELPVSLMRPLLDAHDAAVLAYQKELARVQAANSARQAEHPGLCLEIIIQCIEQRSTKGESPEQEPNRRTSNLAKAERWFRQFPFDVFCARVLGREWRKLMLAPGTQTSLV